MGADVSTGAISVQKRKTQPDSTYFKKKLPSSVAIFVISKNYVVHNQRGSLQRSVKHSGSACCVRAGHHMAHAEAGNKTLRVEG
eukprot:2229571-Rhodomonas_salina.1